MRSILISAALAAALACPAAAEPLDEALALVMSRHPELSARYREFRASQCTSAWSANLDLSLDESLHGSAQLSLSIPLVGKSHELETARARRELESARSAVRQSFLSSVSALRGLALQVKSARERRDFWKDQTEYYRHAVEEGLEDPDLLWSQADRLQQAEHAFQQAKLDFKATLEKTAREYGGPRWTNLQDLLAEIARSSPD